MTGSQEGFKLQEEIAKCLLVGLGYLHSKSIVFNGAGLCKIHWEY